MEAVKNPVEGKQEGSFAKEDSVFKALPSRPSAVPLGDQIELINVPPPVCSRFQGVYLVDEVDAGNHDGLVAIFATGQNDIIRIPHHFHAILNGGEETRDSMWIESIAHLKGGTEALSRLQIAAPIVSLEMGFAGAEATHIHQVLANTVGFDKFARKSLSLLRGSGDECIEDDTVAKVGRDLGLDSSVPKELTDKANSHESLSSFLAIAP
mmetsp:Transcript_64821/g.146239  ORF Transcript_64821/g.146239 Transcript_64821/m.146239 type:complete len:210 (-) Transcript_64821:252-881(-)